jgi:hypothetical protein
MRSIPIALAVVFVAAAPAAAQHPPTFLSAAAEQSWMLNPGQRGPGPIDLGTLGGVAAMFMAKPRLGLEVALSGMDLRPRDLYTRSRFFEGRVHSWLGFHVNYVGRPNARVRPMVTSGFGLMRSQQVFAPIANPNRPDIEGGFPLFIGGGLLTMVTRRVGVRTELRTHPSGEESKTRFILGGGVWF